MLALTDKLLLSDLLVEFLIQLLGSVPVLHLFIKILEVSLLIFIDALLDVVSLLLAFQFFVLVRDHIRHAVHDSLDALTPLLCLSLPSLLIF